MDSTTSKCFCHLNIAHIEKNYDFQIKRENKNKILNKARTNSLKPNEKIIRT